jgi:hypothetical protein
VAVACRADGSDSPSATGAAVPAPATPRPTLLQPLIGPDGKPVLDIDGEPIYVGPTGTRLVDAQGRSLVGRGGVLVRDVGGHAVLVDADGRARTDKFGNPLFAGADGRPLVDSHGTSIVGPSGNLTATVDGYPVQLTPGGNPKTDAQGRPIFVRPDGEPLVDAQGNSLVGPSGELERDAAGNVRARSPGGGGLLSDAAGNPVFRDRSGKNLVDAQGRSLVGKDGTRVVDSNGNPVARDASGRPLMDRNGHPIFIGPAGQPLTDTDGDSVIGHDGRPLLDREGRPRVASNGTHVLPPDGPAEPSGGEIVYDADGQPVLDANGDPIAIADAPGPAAALQPAGVDAFPPVLRLPNGDRAADLPKPVCESPSEGLPPSPSCTGGPAADIPVCLNPNQLVPNENGTIREAIYPRFFPGTTIEEISKQQDKIVRKISEAAGGKSVTVAKWAMVAEGEPGLNARRLMQAADGGVRGFFVIKDAEVADVEEVIKALDELGQEAGGVSATSFFSKTSVRCLLLSGSVLFF